MESQDIPHSGRTALFFPRPSRPKFHHRAPIEHQDIFTHSVLPSYPSSSPLGATGPPTLTIGGCLSIPASISSSSSAISSQPPTPRLFAISPKQPKKFSKISGKKATTLSPSRYNQALKTNPIRLITTPACSF